MTGSRRVSSTVPYVRHFSVLPVLAARILYTKGSEQFLHVVGHWARHVDTGFGHRMDESKPRRMKCLTMKIQLVQKLAMGLLRAAVDLIAKQGVADRGHVNAYLVRSPGLQSTLDQRRAVEDRLPRPMGHRALAASLF